MLGPLMTGGSDVCSHPPTAKGREGMPGHVGLAPEHDEGPLDFFLLIRSFPVPSLSVCYFHRPLRTLLESPLTWSQRQPPRGFRPQCGLQSPREGP